jgi:hypothetical protein
MRGGASRPIPDSQKLWGRLVDHEAAGRGKIRDQIAQHFFLTTGRTVEGFAIDKDGHAFIITDNDGVDDHSGETQFISLGKLNLPM